MGIANKILPHYTYDDWLHWEGRWELIEGHPIAMSPMPTPAHQRVASEIRTELTIALREAGCKHCRAYDPIDLLISEDTILQPDVLVVCGKIRKKFLDFPPGLVVEILSPSTALRDRHTKYEIYEKQGIKFYLIADIEAKKIDVYKLESGKYHHQQQQPFSFQLDDDCTITPDLSGVFD